MKSRVPPRSQESTNLSNDFISLVGYTAKERYSELKLSYKIKSKNFEKTRSDHAEIKKMMDEVVQMLKTENKKMKTMLRYFSRNSQTFLNLFKDCESKLKYLHKTPEEMIDSLECRLGHKKNVLNMLVYRHRKLAETEKDIDWEITFLDKVCGKTKLDNDIADDISQHQTEIEQLLSRVQTSLFIKCSYEPILDLLKTELYFFPIRVQNTEKALAHNKKELAEIKKMNVLAKEAKYQAIKQLKQLQQELDKDRKDRLEVVLMLKKNMAHRADAFEKMKRRRLSVTDLCSEEGGDLRTQLNKTRLTRFKLNDLFGSIKSLILETRIMNACQTMLNNDDMNLFQAKRKVRVDKKYKSMQRLIKHGLVTKEKMVQSNSSNREKYRAATNEVEERVKALHNQMEEKKKKLRADGDLLMNIKKGIFALGSKLRWIDVAGLRQENSISEVIVNITLRIDKLQQMNDDLVSDINQPEMQQEFCLSKLLAKSADRAFSDDEDDRSQVNEMGAAFEDVLEINDDTPMVRNYMKTASKRIIMRQKKK